MRSFTTIACHAINVTRVARLSGAGSSFTFGVCLCSITVQSEFNVQIYAERDTSTFEANEAAVVNYISPVWMWIVWSVGININTGCNCGLILAIRHEWAPCCNPHGDRSAKELRVALAASLLSDKSECRVIMINSLFARYRLIVGSVNARSFFVLFGFYRALTAFFGF